MVEGGELERCEDVSGGRGDLWDDFPGRTCRGGRGYRGWEMPGDEYDGGSEGFCGGFLVWASWARWYG